VKTKAFAAIVLTLFLVTTVFHVFPTLAQDPIKIGIIGPTGLIQGEGMWEGATMAAEEIGTILGESIELEMFDEFQGQAEGTGETGAAAMEQLVAWGADSAIGGFRTESVMGARAIAMDYGIPYLTSGSATDNVIDCGTGTCGACVRCDRARYQYVFRITPVNSTTLVSGVTGIWYQYKYGFLSMVLEKLAALYGSPVKYAVVVENLVWTQGFQAILGNMSFHAYKGLPDMWPFNAVGLADMYLGSPASPTIKDVFDLLYAWGLFPTPGWPVPPGHAKLVYFTAVSPTVTDLDAELSAIKASEARLIIQILSAEKAGRAFTTSYDKMGVKAVPVGINVIEQMSEAWNATAGAVEYQTFLHTTGTRSPITDLSEAFWDAYLARWGRAPIYTAFGAYLAVQILAEAIERAGTIDPDFDPVVNNPEGVPQGRLIREIEATDRLTANGKFKFTGSNGIYHDVHSESFGATWNDGYVRSFMTQWQAGRHEIVWPQMEWPGSPGKYCKLFALPNEAGLMYPYRTDITQDAKVDMDDVAKVGLAYGSAPGDLRWQFLADSPTRDWVVVEKDHSDTASDVISVIDPAYLPLPYCNEGGHLIRP
jgi:branched-chain amino acid transport system substrate-binding protein